MNNTHPTCIESESGGKEEIFNAVSLEEAYAVFYRVCSERPGEYISLTINYRVRAARSATGRYL